MQFVGTAESLVQGRGDCMQVRANQHQLRGSGCCARGGPWPSNCEGQGHDYVMVKDMGLFHMGCWVGIQSSFKSPEKFLPLQRGNRNEPPLSHRQECLATGDMKNRPGSPNINVDTYYYR